MDIKSCVLFTELGQIVVKSLVKRYFPRLMFILDCLNYQGYVRRTALAHCHAYVSQASFL